MSLNEVRLTVAIEDPRARERRLMGMEVGGGWAVHTSCPLPFTSSAMCITLHQPMLLELPHPHMAG